MRAVAFLLLAVLMGPSTARAQDGLGWRMQPAP
jgi:hypothetical protein